MDFLAEQKEIEKILNEKKSLIPKKMSLPKNMSLVKKKEVPKDIVNLVEDFEVNWPRMGEIIDSQNDMHDNFADALETMAKIVGATENRGLMREFGKSVEAIEDGMEEFAYAVADIQNIIKDTIVDVLESLNEEKLDEGAWSIAKGVFKLTFVVAAAVAVSQITGFLFWGLAASVAMSWIMKDSGRWKKNIFAYRDFFKNDLFKFGKMSESLLDKMKKVKKADKRNVRDLNRANRSFEKSRKIVLNALNSITDIIDDLERDKEKYFKREDLKKEDKEFGDIFIG